MLDLAFPDRETIDPDRESATGSGIAWGSCVPTERRGLAACRAPSGASACSRDGLAAEERGDSIDWCKPQLAQPVGSSPAVHSRTLRSVSRMDRVRDFICIDLQRLRSFASQLLEGAPESRTRSDVHSAEAGGEIRGRIPVIIEGAANTRGKIVIGRSSGPPSIDSSSAPESRSWRTCPAQPRVGICGGVTMWSPIGSPAASTWRQNESTT